MKSFLSRLFRKHVYSLYGWLALALMYLPASDLGLTRAWSWAVLGCLVWSVVWGFTTPAEKHFGSVDKQDVKKDKPSGDSDPMV